MPSMIFLVVMIVLMGGMMFWQSKKAKQQQQERNDFRSNLKPGTLVITIGGVIGKVVSVDTQYEEIVIDSEGSKLRFSFNAISKEYIRPAFVSDDDVDENGNPLPAVESAGEGNPAEVSGQAQTPVETSESTDADSQNAAK